MWTFPNQVVHDQHFPSVQAKAHQAGAYLPVHFNYTYSGICCLTHPQSLVYQLLPVTRTGASPEVYCSKMNQEDTDWKTTGF